MRRSFRRRPLLLGVALALLPVALASLQGCFDDDDGPTRPPDTAVPASTKLVITDVTESSVAFQWRAPGDDGTAGTAASYDLRYATSSFDEATWSSATPASGLPAPSPSPAVERFTVQGLEPGTTYFFAIRSHDDASNWSPISNLIIITLPLEAQCPVLWNGHLLLSEGTVTTAFVYRVWWRTEEEEEPADLAPSVVIADSTFSMTHVDGTFPGDVLYEYDTLLEPGTYDYYFTMADSAGRASRLPSTGTWSGPTVETSTTFEGDVIDVPAGTFIMGNADPASDCIERPQHEVTLTHPFQIDRYEVTNTQVCDFFNQAYEQGQITIICDTLVTTSRGDILLRVAPRGADASHGIQFTTATGFTPMPFRDHWPVTHITWFGAAFYCNLRNEAEGLAASYATGTWATLPQAHNPYACEGWRLPTEAEWEYVARYDDGRTYPTGNTTPQPGVEGNFAWTIGHPTPVGQYSEGSSALGLLDLTGNVYEWCNDRKAPYSEGPQTDPTGSLDRPYRVVRGGSWGSSTDELRCAFRFSVRPNNAYDGLGFRCVRSM
ncbi:MAG: SUMF1/EgtB/PvdO family nonheme iron enzyme [Candidatus Eisenbacteria sp.]|nr:SUMF1/EgtB/PvdO family nonheme iron enzyme [Candidatus Eisenbacteria bacterium]